MLPWVAIVIYTQLAQERGCVPIHTTRCKWTEIKIASKWGAYQQNLTGVFWNMATLTPLFWAKSNFFWIFHILGKKCVAILYFLFSTLFCFSTIQKWPRKCLSTPHRYHKGSQTGTAATSRSTPTWPSCPPSVRRRPCCLFLHTVSALHISTARWH